MLNIKTHTKIDDQIAADELTAENPLFDVALNLRIEEMRALHDAMMLSSAELASANDKTAFVEMPVEEPHSEPYQPKVKIPR